MTKSLANKILLKEHLCIFSIRSTPIQNHLDDFNSILTVLESVDVQKEDEDKDILL